MSLSSTIAAAIHTTQVWAMWIGTQMQILFAANPAACWSGVGLIALGVLYMAYSFCSGGKKPKKSTEKVGKNSAGVFPRFASPLANNPETPQAESNLKATTPTENDKDSSHEVGKNSAGEFPRFASPLANNQKTPQATPTGDNANSDHDVGESDVISVDTSSESGEEQDFELQDIPTASTDQTNIRTSTQQQPSERASHGASDQENHYEGFTPQSNNANEGMSRGSDVSNSHDDKRVMQEAVMTIASHLAADAVLNEVNRNTFFTFNGGPSTGEQDAQDRYGSPVRNPNECMTMTVLNKAWNNTNAPVRFDTHSHLQEFVYPNLANQTYGCDTSWIDSKSQPINKPSSSVINGFCPWGEVSNSTQFPTPNPDGTTLMCMPANSSNFSRASRLAPSGGSLNQVGMFGYGIGTIQRSVGPITLGVSFFMAIPWLMLRTFVSIRTRAGH